MEKVTKNAKKTSENGVNPARSLAVKILNRYDRSDSYIDKLLEVEMQRNELISKDKALLTHLVNGTTRWRAKLDWVLIGFFHGEFHKCLNIVKNAMRVALYQILFMDRIPSHAAINESVELVKGWQGQNAASLVNGVLRNIDRKKESIRYPDPKQDRAFYLSIIHSHPKWITKKWIANWGEQDTIEIMKANNRIPTLPFRVNLYKSSVDEIKAFFDELGVEYRVSKINEETIKVRNLGRNLSELDIFIQGKVSVQDSSATLAARLTDAKPGMKVIDLCAAPGGKTFKLAEMMENKGKLVANDKYWGKLKILTNEAKRLGVDIIETYKEDAAECTAEELADVVLIDAPCSGTGTFRKKPGIKWKREPEDIDKLNIIQKDIIANAPNLIKKDGAIVYSTCSMEPEENMQIAEWFLKNFPEFKLDPAEKYLPNIVCKDGYMQAFPHLHKTDGAFAARFIRK